MSLHGIWLRSLALAGVVLAAGLVSARALDPIEFNLSAPPAQDGKHVVSAADDDEDEESFFSTAARPRLVTGAVTSTARSPEAIESRRAAMNVAAACRAALADRRTYYDTAFLYGCQKIIAQNGRN